MANGKRQTGILPNVMRVVGVCLLGVVLFGVESRAWAEDVRIASIHFEGVEAVSEDVLYKGLLLREGMAVDRAWVVRDMKQILGHYRTLGYWQAQVHFPNITVQKDQAVLVYRIDEGIRTRIDAVEINEQAALADSVLGEVALAPDMVLTDKRLDDQLNNMLRFYENRGYPFCVLEPEVKFDDEKARIKIDIRPGPFCVVDTVVFKGNTVTRDRVLLREMRLEWGATYDQRKIDQAVRRLRRLAFLHAVEDAEIQRHGDKTTVVVRVEEARSARVEGAVGYAPDTEGNGITGAFLLDIHNVAGAGRLGHLSWRRTGDDASDLQIRFEEPWVFNKPFAARFELEMRERLGFSEWQVGMGVSMRYGENGTLWTQGLRGRVVPDSVGMGVYEKSTRWTLRVGGRVDTRDDMWNPRYGWVGESVFEIGRVEDVQHVAIRRLQTVSIHKYFPFHKRSVWALGGRGLWVSQKGGVPLDAQIRVGGATSLRGYREEAFLATKGGWISWEWRYLVGARSRLFGFIDAGVLDGVSGRVMPVGYGVGMVLASQIGVVGLDVGWSKEDGIEDGKLHVRVIHAF